MDLVHDHLHVLNHDRPLRKDIATRQVFAEAAPGAIELLLQRPLLICNKPLRAFQAWLRGTDMVSRTIN